MGRIICDRKSYALNFSNWLVARFYNAEAVKSQTRPFPIYTGEVQVERLTDRQVADLYREWIGR